MGHRQKGKAKKRRKSRHHGRAEAHRFAQADADLPRVIACIANDVGRGTWIEALGPEPAGDCEGALYRVLGTDARLCERHLLQYSLAGRKLLATKVNEPQGAEA